MGKQFEHSTREKQQSTTERTPHLDGGVSDVELSESADQQRPHGEKREMAIMFKALGQGWIHYLSLLALKGRAPWLLLGNEIMTLRVMGSTYESQKKEGKNGVMREKDEISRTKRRIMLARRF